MHVGVEHPGGEPDERRDEGVLLRHGEGEDEHAARIGRVLGTLHGDGGRGRWV